MEVAWTSWIGAWATRRLEPSGQVIDKEREAKSGVDRGNQDLTGQDLLQKSISVLGCSIALILTCLARLHGERSQNGEHWAATHQQLSCFCIHLGSLSRGFRAWFETHQLSRGFKSCRWLFSSFPPGVSLTNRCNASVGSESGRAA